MRNEKTPPGGPIYPRLVPELKSAISGWTAVGGVGGNNITDQTKPKPYQT